MHAFQTAEIEIGSVGRHPEPGNKRTVGFCVGTAQLRSPSFYNFGGLGAIAAEQHRTTRADYTRLLERYLGHGITQILCMIQRDSGNDAEQRSVENIGGVQPSAHTAFDNCHINLFPSEILKPYGCYKLELGRRIRHSVGKRSYGIGNVGEHVIRYHFPADAHSLTEKFDIRRCEHTGTIPRGAQNAVQHCAERALSVGSGNVNNAKLLLRVTEQ